jgi:Transcriptional regulators
MRKINFGVLTIKDIAKALNVSVSSVSKALKDSHEISEKTRKLIQDYAKKHNFQPNPMAQSLRHGNSRSIGIVVPEIDNPFFSQVINGIESIANKKQYNISISQTHESYEVEKRNIQHLTTRAITGLLISLSAETKNIDHIKALHTQGLPIVFFDRVNEEINTHKVVVNNFQGAYDGTTELIKSGYKRIAHITSSRNSFVTSERLKGYRAALKENNIKPQAAYVKYCAHSGREPDEIGTAIDELLKTENKPDAIFTASDRITTTTLSMLNKRGISIPNEMALLGFTNTQFASDLNPSLSTVFQPGFEMGERAMEMLIGIIESKRPIEEFLTTELPAIVIARNSSLPIDN